VEFIHSRGSSILLDKMGPGAPQVYVSLIDGARSHIARTGSTTGIFRPDALAAVPGKAKFFFPGFTIRFTRDHQFTNSAGVLETLTVGDYQGQFHWHDGQGRLTIDASSYPLTADGSRHPHFSADFAYYSLPLLLTPVIQEWVASRATGLPHALTSSPHQHPSHELALAEFLRIPAQQVPAPTSHPSMSSQGAQTSSQVYKPMPGPHFLAADRSGQQTGSRLFSMGPTPFSTPPMPKKTLFQDSPQSETQKSHSAAFGHSPGPSPSWEQTPQSQRSWHSRHGEDRPICEEKEKREQPIPPPPSYTYAQTNHITMARPENAGWAATVPVTVTTQVPPPTSPPTGPQFMSAPPQQEQTVRPVMTSSRKRAAIGSLSPQIRPLLPQSQFPAAFGSHPSVLEPEWETRFQLAVRQAMITLTSPAPTPHGQNPQTQEPLPLPLSAAALAEAEAAHAAQGQRLKEARELQNALVLEAARKDREEAARREALQAQKVAEESKRLQEQLQDQLRELAAADAAAAQAFADRRAQMAKASHDIAQRLQALQSSTQPQSTPLTFQGLHDRNFLPPHLAQSVPAPGATSSNSHQHQGSMGPSIPAQGLAEPQIPFQVPAVPAQTAPQNGVPQPGEAFQE
jgi:hypothetical protein